ncbi:MAG: hypothetical protein IJQ58_04540, partial [Synergistaceae bacterium]|nr:hypothetical protein [Synergistaceae bacterium]
AYAPKFSSNTTPVVRWTSAGNIYAHVGDEVHAGLIVEADGSIYDISETALGVASYSVSDPTIAEILSDGKIKALKEGTTRITATAYGHTASVNFVVKPTASETDTTKDISSSSGNNTPGGSSGGGCNGFAAMMAIPMILAAMMVRKQRG